MDNSPVATKSTRSVDNQGGGEAREAGSREGGRNTGDLDNKEAASQLKEEDILELREVDNRIRS